MNRFSILTIVIVGLICSLGSVTAEEIVLEEMVVTASRSEEALGSIPASVSVVTREEIVGSTARDVADLLRTEAGVYVKDITGGRRNYTVDLRGFGETAPLNTLVLVDGRRTNQADLSGTDWTQIPIDQVERIEIIRGGRASVFYGDNAAGGVVNIITKKSGEDHGGLEVQVGSYETYKASAFKSGTVGDFSYLFSGSYLETDGYRDNSDNEAKDFGGDFGYDISDRFAVNAGAGYHEDTARLPGAIKESDFEEGVSRTDSLYPDDYQDSEDYYFRITPEGRFSANGVAKIDMSYRNRSTLGYSSGDWGSFTGDTEIETVSVTPQLIFDREIFGFVHSLNAGMDYSNVEEHIINTSNYDYLGWIFTSTGVFDLKKENFGYYINDELTVTPEFTVSGGYRYDRAEYTFGTSLGTVDPDSTELDESLYTVDVNYSFNSASNFYLSYSKSYRYPVLDELFSYVYNTIDPSLVPQTSNDYEAGFRYAFGGGFFVGLNLFYIETMDEIYYDSNSYANTNLDGDTIRQGAELTMGEDFTWGQLDVNYTYTDAEIDGGTYDGSTFPDVPEHQAGFSFLLDAWKPFSVALNGKYVGERFFTSDWANSYGKQDDYFVMNAKVKYESGTFTTYMDINNLLNTEYEEYTVISAYTNDKSYYPSPKINLLVGVSVEF
jgi:iron complex outermembrane receptor protein